MRGDYSLSDFKKNNKKIINIFLKNGSQKEFDFFL